MLYNLLQQTQAWLDEHGLYQVVMVLNQLEFRAFFAVVMSFVIVLFFGKPTIRWLLKQKIGDVPEFYNADINKLMASKASTPTMGGILICASIAFTILMLADLRNTYVHLSLIVLVWLAAVGGIDDWLKLTSKRRHAALAPGSTGSTREGLFAWEKLLFQLGVATIAGIFLYRAGMGADAAHVLTMPFQRTYVPGAEPLQLEQSAIILGPVAFVIVSVLVIAGTSNAVNLTDGMDGLASGTMSIAAFTMMALAFISGDVRIAKFLLFPHVPGTQEMMVVSGAMAGACLGFLWFNCSPAKVFMGDTGALALGGLLAFVAVAIRQEILLIVIGGVFFMEMASVIMQVGYFKLTRGKRIFRMSPIHHHFQLAGWSEPQVVTRFWILGVVLAMAALVSIKLRWGLF